MKAVFSWWVKEKYGTYGFNSFKDFSTCISLAVNTAKKHFDQIELVTNDIGREILVDKLKLPFTSVNLKLNELKDFNHTFWAYGKILAYAEQKEPFVHIDNDVFLWDGIPDKVKESPIFFQSLEPFDQDFYSLYKPLKKLLNDAPQPPKSIINNSVEDYAYNCGICGANDLSLIKEWKKNIDEWLKNKDNLSYMLSQKDMKIHLNLLFEQYFISSILEKNKVRDKVGILLEGDIHKACITNFRYTHLWGDVKKDQNLMKKVDLKLKQLYPEVYNNLLKLK